MRLPSALSAKLGLIGGTLLVPASIGLTPWAAWPQRIRSKLKVLYRQETMVKHHVQHILRKLDRSSRAQAAEHAAECSP